jgi:hypothetical protein
MLSSSGGITLAASPTGAARALILIRTTAQIHAQYAGSLQSVLSPIAHWIDGESEGARVSNSGQTARGFFANI